MPADAERSALVRPGPQHQWVHSACKKAKLEHALSSPHVTAIEADIMMGERDGLAVPVMAHPVRCGQLPVDWDTTFEDFIERCVGDGRRHLKLDFKQIEAVAPVLKLVAERLPQLRANGQGVWLNADVLPGPNKRGAACKVPAHRFLPLWRTHLPQATLSLGWNCHTFGMETGFTHEDVRQMLHLCREYGVPGHKVVFCPSVRLAASSVPQLAGLLDGLDESQLLLWTGTGEVPVLQRARESLDAQFTQVGMQDRIGYDIFVAQHTTEVVAALVAEWLALVAEWLALVAECMAECGCARRHGGVTREVVQSEH